MTTAEKAEKRQALLDRLGKLDAKVADSTQQISGIEERELFQINLELTKLDADIDPGQDNTGIGRHDFDNRHKATGLRHVTPAPAVKHRSCVPEWASVRTREPLKVVAPEQSIATFQRSDENHGIREDDLDLGRYLRGVIGGNWRGADAEKELCQRALTSYEGVSGGYLVPQVLSNRVIDVSRAKAVTQQAGVMTMPLEGGSTSIALMDSDPTVYGKAENDTATESTPTVGQRTLNPVTRMILVKIPREVWDDSVAPPGFFENAFGQAMAVDMDKMTLRGLGAGHEPTGIRHWSGINTTQLGSGSGAALSGFSDFLDAMQTVAENNGPEPSQMAAVMAPRSWYDLARKIDGQGLPLQAPQAYTDMARYYTTQVPINLTADVAGAETYSNASEIYLGNFSQVLMGVRQGITVKTTDQGAAMAANQIWLAVIVRYDIVIARANQLTLIEGVLADS